MLEKGGRFQVRGRFCFTFVDSISATTKNDSIYIPFIFDSNSSNSPRSDDFLSAFVRLVLAHIDHYEIVPHVITSSFLNELLFLVAFIYLPYTCVVWHMYPP